MLFVEMRRLSVSVMDSSNTESLRIVQSFIQRTESQTEMLEVASEQRTWEHVHCAC